jgi:ribonuclease Z
MRSTFLVFLLLHAAPASAQSIYVRLLGTAGPSLNPNQAEAGLLVVAGSEVLLFDCGHGIPNRLAQVNRIGVSKLFLTHVHSDHTEGLAELWMNENTWSARGNTPLSVFGPPELAPDQPSGTADITNQLTTAFATNTHIRRDLVEHLPGGGIMFQTTEIANEGVVYQNNGVTVTAFLVDHGVVKPAYGYRVDYQGHSVVFSGDTTFTPNLVKNAQGVDVLVHEVLLSPLTATPQNDSILSYHSTPEQAAQTFRQAAPKLAVYTHIVDQTGGGAAGLINRTRAAGYTGPLEVGQDLTLIEIGDTISVLRCPSTSNPSIAAITNTNYQNAFSAGDTVSVWGRDFSVGGNLVFWSPANGGPTITLSETDGLYFWDQSSSQLNATLDPRITPGLWYVSVENSCILQSGVFQTFAVTVAPPGSQVTVTPKQPLPHGVAN